MMVFCSLDSRPVPRIAPHPAQIEAARIKREGDHARISRQSGDCAGRQRKIGQAVVAAFRAADVRVMVADITPTPEAEGVAFQLCDLRDNAQITALVAATKTQVGHIDFLVNVACSYLDNGLPTTRADWLTALDINIIGSVMLVQAAQANLAANKGAIVNFGSISSRVAQTRRWVYPVSKATILQLSRSRAIDLAPHGIPVDAVSPGWTWRRAKCCPASACSSTPCRMNAT